MFAIVSGLYWWLIGQILPFAVPMMLKDEAMMVRILAETAAALVVYVAASMLFFGWLLSGSKVR